MLNRINSFTVLADSSLTDAIADWCVRVMETLGGPGAALLIALENIFPPLPSEIVLPLAGFTASQGDLSLMSAIVWTTIGSLAGAILLYYLGSWLGRDRIRHFANKLPLVDVSDVDKSEKWFTKYENQAVFFGRMIPVVRSLVSIPAGIEKMPLKIFIVYTAAGSLIWNSVLIGAGYTLGEQWHVVEDYVGILQYIVLLAIAAAVLYFVVRKLKSKKN